ncbi:MAG: hypothetical protein QG635_2127, partial [Bacteroidota bacterium]|nr:hypothetical protein [Bacteroidota bacterium]
KMKVGIKVYALEVLKRIARHFPEIQNEIVLLIKKHLPYSQMAFRSRALRCLKELNIMYEEE